MWRQHMFMLCMVMFCAIIQTTIAPLIPFGAQPDLLFAIVVLSGLFLDPTSGALYAFGIGALQDILIAGPMGVFMFDRVAIYILANSLSREFYAKSAIAQFVVIAILVIVEILLITVLLLIFASYREIPFEAKHILLMPIRMISTAVFGMPLFFLMKLIWD